MLVKKAIYISGTIHRALPVARRKIDPHLNSNRLVVFEAAQAVLSFQGVAIGVLCRIECGRWQVFPVRSLTQGNKFRGRPGRALKPGLLLPRLDLHRHI